MASTILLKNVPKDIMRTILKVQSEVKMKKEIGKYSQEKAVYKIISDYAKSLTLSS